MEDLSLKKLSINKDKIRKISNKINGNLKIAGFYKNLASKGYVSEHRAFNLTNCFKFFNVDYYRLQKVKDLTRVNLCHDLFCINCQNQKSERQYAKLKPLLDMLEKSFSIYHTVFTVPNCSGALLKSTIDKMQKTFAKLIRYFQGSKKLRGIDFSKYGFYGAVRNFEVTINCLSFGQYEFHPHFHCLFILDKKFREVPKHLNKFSFSRSELRRDISGKRFFTDTEILLQKLWYLLYNDIKVTKKAIDSLELGYSCYMQRCISDFKEVFKYAVKGLYDKRTSEFEYSEHVFESLFFSLHKRHLLQGYGIFRKFNFEDLDDSDSLYDSVISELQLLEYPLPQEFKLNTFLEDIQRNNDITYISKNSYRAKVDKK